MRRIVDTSVIDAGLKPSPLQADLVALLRATQDAEHDLFGALDAATRDAANTIGSWSAKDVQAHLAAWRAIEARRLATTRGETGPHAGDPALGDPVEESNARLHAQHADWPWESVARHADASIEALIGVIGRSTSEALCECNDDIAGIGANGANHAMGHLSEIALMSGDHEHFDGFAREVEAILRRNHLPPRDSGVILYNLACHRALAGDLDEARRVLRAAFARRHDLAEQAKDDPDLISLREELTTLAVESSPAS
jgi:hypothetical protein